MDQRERSADSQETLLTALDALQTRIWTSGPGIIESFNPDKLTAEVQYAIQGQTQNKDTGAWSDVNIPLLVDCPVIFPGGGGFVLTFPVKKGDECLCIFAKNTIDAWWQNGDVQPMGSYRVHDLSDGFILVGPFSAPNVPANISTGSVQLRSTDGATVMSLSDGTLTFNGNLFVDGNVSAGNGITASVPTGTGQIMTFINGILTGLV